MGMKYAVALVCLVLIAATEYSIYQRQKAKTGNEIPLCVTEKKQN
jgi:hypothetical protein